MADACSRVIERALEGHFDHPHGRNWMYIADSVHPHFADLVGEHRRIRSLCQMLMMHLVLLVV